MRFRKTAGLPAKLFLLVAAFVLALAASSFPALAKNPTLAPATTPSATQPLAPDTNSNPVIADLIKAGAKFFYLGSRSGLEGWLIVKDGQVQIAYVITGTHDVIIGALFGPDGENITAQQIQDVVKQNKDLVDTLKQAYQQPQSAGAAPVDADATKPPAASQLGEQLMKEFEGAKSVTLGSATAPQVYMVMDPSCPHCRATWKVLRDSVINNKLQLHMIPIAAPGSDEERAAARLMQATDPLTSWDKYVAGDASQLGGEADPALVANVRANDVLIDRWHIDVTPWLVYRSKTGEIKIIKGEVLRAAAVLGDLQ